MEIKSKKSFLFCAALLCAMYSFAQADSTNKARRKNIVYGELFGNTLIVSINYERIFWQKGEAAFSVRAGYSSVKGGAIGEGQDPFRSVPVECIVMFGIYNHFEMSIGGTNMFVDEETYDESKHITYTLLPTGRIGYRYQAPQGRFMLRAGVCILPGLVLPGLAMGYAF